MRDSELPYVAEQVFLDSKKQPRGDAAIEWSEKVIFERLLTPEPTVLHEDGIHVGNRRFWHEKLSDVYNAWMESSADRRVKPRVDVSPVPFLSSTYAWLRSPNEIIYLRESSDDYVGLRSISYEEDVALFERDAAKGRAHETTAPNKSLLRQSQQAAVDAGFQLKPTKPRHRSASNQSIRPEREWVLKQQERELANQVASTLEIPGVVRGVTPTPTAVSAASPQGDKPSSAPIAPQEAFPAPSGAPSPRRRDQWRVEASPR